MLVNFESAMASSSSHATIQRLLCAASCNDPQLVRQALASCECVTDWEGHVGLLHDALLHAVMEAVLGQSSACEPNSNSNAMAQALRLLSSACTARSDTGHIALQFLDAIAEASVNPDLESTTSTRNDDRLYKAARLCASASYVSCTSLLSLLVSVGNAFPACDRWLVEGTNDNLPRSVSACDQVINLFLGTVSGILATFEPAESVRALLRFTSDCDATTTYGSRCVLNGMRDCVRTLLLHLLIKGAGGKHPDLEAALAVALSVCELPSRGSSVNRFIAAIYSTSGSSVSLSVASKLLDSQTVVKEALQMLLKDDASVKSAQRLSTDTIFYAFYLLSSMGRVSSIQQCLEWLTGDPSKQQPVHHSVVALVVSLLTKDHTKKTSDSEAVIEARSRALFAEPTAADIALKVCARALSHCEHGDSATAAALEQRIIQPACATLGILFEALSDGVGRSATVGPSIGKPAAGSPFSSPSGVDSSFRSALDAVRNSILPGQSSAAPSAHDATYGSDSSSSSIAMDVELALKRGRTLGRLLALLNECSGAASAPPSILIQTPLAATGGSSASAGSAAAIDVDYVDIPLSTAVDVSCVGPSICFDLTAHVTACAGALGIASELASAGTSAAASHPRSLAAVRVVTLRRAVAVGFQQLQHLTAQVALQTSPTAASAASRRRPESPPLSSSSALPSSPLQGATVTHDDVLAIVELKRRRKEAAAQSAVAHSKVGGSGAASARPNVLLEDKDGDDVDNAGPATHSPASGRRFDVFSALQRVQALSSPTAAASSYDGPSVPSSWPSDGQVLSPLLARRMWWWASHASEQLCDPVKALGFCMPLSAAAAGLDTCAVAPSSLSDCMLLLELLTDLLRAPPLQLNLHARSSSINGLPSGLVGQCAGSARGTEGSRWAAAAPGGYGSSEQGGGCAQVRWAICRGGHVLCCKRRYFYRSFFQ